MDVQVSFACIVFDIVIVLFSAGMDYGAVGKELLHHCNSWSY